MIVSEGEEVRKEEDDSRRGRLKQPRECGGRAATIAAANKIREPPSDVMRRRQRTQCRMQRKRRLWTLPRLRKNISKRQKLLVILHVSQVIFGSFGLP